MMQPLTGSAFELLQTYWQIAPQEQEPAKHWARIVDICTSFAIQHIGAGFFDEEDMFEWLAEIASLRIQEAPKLKLSIVQGLPHGFNQ